MKNPLHLSLRLGGSMFIKPSQSFLETMSFISSWSSQPKIKSSYSVFLNRSGYRSTKAQVYNFSSLQKQSLCKKKVTNISEQSCQLYHSRSKSMATSTDSVQVDYMVVGLGNHHLPATRHSIGMTAVDKFASMLRGEWQPGARQYGGYCCHAVWQPHSDITIRLLLFKPKAFMNVNGTSVSSAAKAYSVPPQNIYLVHDELNLEPGKIKLKEGGTSGGHKGVSSCIYCLHKKVMPRLRVGIGRPSHVALVPMFVLDSFSQDEQTKVSKGLGEGLELMLGHMEERSLKGEGYEKSQKQKTKRKRVNKKARLQEVIKGDGKEQMQDLSSSVSDSIKHSVTCDSQVLSKKENSFKEKTVIEVIPDR